MFNRRQLLKYGVASAPFLTAQAPKQTLTVTFKKIGNLEIRADVTGAEPGASKPAIMWIHGGALIHGRRGSDISGYFMERLLQHGFVVVAIDYRLAPESKLPDMIEDVRSAWSWILREGVTRFGIDVRRIAVGGGSAGAYLALMTGFSLRPRPKFVVSMEGWGELTGAWIAQPNPHFLKSGLITEQEARATIGTIPIAEATSDKGRSKFIKYSRQEGTWLEEVTGHSLTREPDWFVPFCPLKNISAEYPPTILVHGDADEDVPLEQSKLLAAELKRKNVRHELIVMPGGDHGLHGFSPAEYGRLYDRVVAFLK